MTVAQTDRPPVSDRKLAANRANAAKSTGPRSAEGKARSAGNALKHGLRAELVVLPTEDASAFEASRDAWVSDWQPASEAAATLVERAAVTAWRLRRCVRLETTRFVALGRSAVDDYEAEVRSKIETGLQLLESDPAAGLELLSSFHQGADQLRREWLDLARTATESGAWSDLMAHHARVLALMGVNLETDDEPAMAFAVVSLRVIAFNTRDADAPDDATERARTEADCMKIARFAYSRVDQAEALMARLPAPDSLRSRLADAAAFDPSPEGLSLARYEATHDRAFRSTLAALIKVTDRDRGSAANEPTEDPVPAPAPSPFMNEPTANPDTIEDRSACSNEPTVPRVGGDDPSSLTPLVPPNEPTVPQYEPHRQTEAPTESLSRNEPNLRHVHLDPDHSSQGRIQAEPTFINTPAPFVS